MDQNSGRQWVSSKRIVRVCLVGIALVLAGSEARAAADSSARVRCTRMVFPVALAPDLPADQELVGWLCARGSVHHKTVQVLIHGATYDHHYWDWPRQPEQYSYVDHMTAAGYAVLNLDRVGYGESSRPADGLAVTLHTGAFTIHQVVQALRSGTKVVPGLGRIRAERVQLVGSSLGAFIATIEASTYHDVDGVILSSYSHTLGPAALLTQVLSYDARMDPKFAHLPITNYLTTTPGARGPLYYFVPGADPANILLDETLKQTVTIGEDQDIFPSLFASLGVTVPTLVVNGDHDMITCTAPSCTATGSLANEAMFYGPDACVEIQIVPDSGHALNTHLNAPTAFSMIRAWSDRRVGASTKRPAPEPCP